MTSGDASLAHVLGRLSVIEARVRAIVAERRATDPSPDDPFRGLYLSDEHVDRLLAGQPETPPVDRETADRLAAIEQGADTAAAAGADIRLRRLASAFDLTPLDVELLLVALAPDLDARFERLYSYLHDDVTRRRASIGLALDLCATPLASGPARQRLMETGPLLTAGLVEVGDIDRPFLTRTLHVPDRVTAHLLGGDDIDAELQPYVADVTPEGAGDAEPLVRAVRSGARLLYLRERLGASGRGLSVAALQCLGMPAIALDLARLRPGDVAATVARVAAREARLRAAGLVAGPIDALLERDATSGVRAFAEAPGVVMLVGRHSWDPAWSRDVPVLVDAHPPDAAMRLQLWRGSLNGRGDESDDALDSTTHFRLTPEQVHRATLAARQQAVLDGGQLTPAHLRAGARSQNGAGLEHQARRVEPAVAWSDLVLPPACLAGLRELSARARHRDRVIDDWGMRPGGGRGRGITALFAGDSGTGKTMSAEVIAGELGLDLYAINLATVVDKYVGETEKNLERIFAEADGVNAVLLFDEADALFGKRSEVRDAHDRYANIEVAYLLQRMETFDGLAILATNLRANLDDAFARRLDAVIDFPMPAVDNRRALWEKCLGAEVPRRDDVDLDFCAARFELSGGNIRSIAVTAAYFAAVSGEPVGMLDLMRATQREYRKLGRLCVPSEFGPWFELVT
jgi:hypothetical protein